MIEQSFTKVKTLRVNGKAERVIKTIMELWHPKILFASPEHRQKERKRFINFFNGVRPHKGIGDLMLEGKRIRYFYPEKL